MLSCCSQMCRCRCAYCCIIGQNKWRWSFSLHSFALRHLISRIKLSVSVRQPHHSLAISDVWLSDSLVRISSWLTSSRTWLGVFFLDSPISSSNNLALFTFALTAAFRQSPPPKNIPFPRISFTDLDSDGALLLIALKIAFLGFWYRRLKHTFQSSPYRFMR